MYFVVEKTAYPEWGVGSHVVFRKFFEANSRETLESVLRDRYGEFHKYCKYDEIEEIITIEEIEVERI